MRTAMSCACAAPTPPETRGQAAAGDDPGLAGALALADAGGVAVVVVGTALGAGVKGRGVEASGGAWVGEDCAAGPVHAPTTTTPSARTSDA